MNERLQGFVFGLFIAVLVTVVPSLLTGNKAEPNKQVNWQLSPSCPPAPPCPAANCPPPNCPVPSCPICQQAPPPHQPFANAPAATQKLVGCHGFKDEFSQYGRQHKRDTFPYDPSTYNSWDTKTPNLCLYLNLNCQNCWHRFGVRLTGISHADNIFLDFVITAHPKLNNFVELGTEGGVTSFYFGVVAKMRGGGQMHTFDIHDVRRPEVKRVWMENMFFHQDSIFDVVGSKNVTWLLNTLPNVFGFFDNGHKENEIKSFLKFMARPGNVMCTHDWDDEVGLPGIKSTLEENRFQPFAWDFAEHLGTHVRCWLHQG
eukprot:TRINITY_DN1516_c0_g1_i2.p2 TRINITY_DN1516_c0_g1~~TRINITY_DN1516_c0_g1_i2.p2  ORF type:complete len:316 (+),score=100.44 TRINITY_DN1516_c0_g1_i2:94-1041(+)